MSSSHPAKYLIVITAVLASLLEIIDTSIVNVAMPHMQGNLGATISEITWVSTSYIIANAVILPVAAWLSHRLGRKQYYTWCIGIFTVSSLACGLAPNLGTLIMFRIIQGAAGGALLPTSQALIQEQFRGPKAGIGSAIYGMSIMIGPAIGPTIGGWLTDQYNWRYIFYINIPLGILAAIMAFLFIESASESKDAKKEKVDVWGFVFLVLGIGCFQFVLERGQLDDWFNSTTIIITTATALIAIPTFFAWEWNHENPLVNVRLFKERTVLTGTLLISLVGMALYSVNFLIPQYADRILGMDATQTGLLFVPFALSTMLSMAFVGPLLARIGPKPFIFIGISMVAFTFWRFTNYSTDVSTNHIILTLMTQGAGLGCLFVPINTAVVGQMPRKDIEQTTGLLNLCRQLGGGIGLAGISTFLDRFSAQFQTDMSRSLNQSNWSAISTMQAAQMQVSSKMAHLTGLLDQSLGLSQGSEAGLKSLQGRMAQQAFQLSFNRLMALSLGIFVFAYVPWYFLKIDKKIKGPVGGH